MEAVPEEDFANLENVTQTVEVVRIQEPLRSYPTIPEKFDMIASVHNEKNFQSQFPKVDACCFSIDLGQGINIWIILETLIWILLFSTAFYFEIMYIQAFDLFQFEDEMESWYSVLVFGEEVYFIDHKIRSKWNSMFKLIKVINIKICQHFYSIICDD